MALETASHTQLNAVLDICDHHKLTVPTFVVSVLRHPDFSNHPAVTDLVAHSDDILGAFLKHPRTSDSTLAWAHGIIKSRYAQLIRDLADKENGWHFSAANTSAAQLQEFRIEDMATKMKTFAPELWDLLGLLLSANRQPDIEEDNVMDTDLLEDSPAQRAQKHTERRDALIVIKKVVMISVMMQSTNAKCNALESVFGIFLHASNTPYKVIETLAHMGISISSDAIENAVHSLSRETHRTLRAMGETLLVGYAYDNFDINFPGIVPVVEKSTDTLTHLTSAGLIFLEHGVEADHLRCSDELWKKNPLNPAFNASTAPPTPTMLELEQHLDKLHPETAHPSDLTCRERFNAWLFRSDLIAYGPSYFDVFSAEFGNPEMIEQIPVVQMRWAPARSLDVKQSTVAGNLQAIPEFIQQGGVGDPTEKVQGPWLPNLLSIIAFVILFHGDLGTGERIMSLLQRRAIEDTPWRRYQYVIYVMGLFHLKMAAADAIWRIFIEPKVGREDQTSLMHFVALLRPKETGKIGSDPGFRRMHEVIAHVGAALRVDAWRVEVLRRNPQWKSLQHFADSKPSFALITEISNYLASHYVAGAENRNIFELRQKPKPERDQQNENVLQMHQYFSLYEELSFAINFGDIGRVETLFPTWIYIFKATGKHKYASHMKKFMADLHFVYPAPLRHAIRYNMMPNPTGKAGKCRGVDWVVEQMINLPTKVGSRHTPNLFITHWPSSFSGHLWWPRIKLHERTSSRRIPADSYLQPVLREHRTQFSPCIIHFPTGSPGDD
ncbi:hypothetical protein GGX14DRAFT_374434 [Mycena pura]|uniref:DUF6589 domain-containing protein n=1 Tax=Mycena pura TaxID=153505 RepID=A0AAD6Y9R9_9AGAR|nr:hypothetical protein GGX14DRAFT_374434 [Mycena pura]